MLGSISVWPSHLGSYRVNQQRSFCCCLPLQGVRGRLCNPSSSHTPCPSCNTPVKPCLRRLSNVLAGAFGCSHASLSLCHPINISALTPVKHRSALKRASETPPRPWQPLFCLYQSCWLMDCHPLPLYLLAAPLGCPPGPSSRLTGPGDGAGWLLRARWCLLNAWLKFLLLVRSGAQPKGNNFAARCEF